MTNPLLLRGGNGGQPGATIVNGQAIPTEIREYAAWLNTRERRPGTWRVVDRDGYRQVEFMQERGTADWLAEKGFVPRVGSRPI